MLRCFKLIRNIGQFDSVPTTQPVAFGKLTLIYADNGRGKTTLAAMLRSLATGDACPIQERGRLGAQHPPHVVVERWGVAQPLVFQNGVWSQTHADIRIYDDRFVNDNVYSGLEVTPGHKQNLHELIIGAQGVALARRVEGLADSIASLNREIRAKETAIPAQARNAMTVEQFCTLTERKNIDGAIQDAKRNLTAVQEADSVQTTPGLPDLVLPDVGFAAIEELLLRDLPALNAAAAEMVRNHVVSLGTGGEAWVARGTTLTPTVEGTCPFCAQTLAGSPLVRHYQTYFSHAYSELKRDVQSALDLVTRLLGGDAIASFERAVGSSERLRLFWSRLCEVPAVEISVTALAVAWQDARDALLTLLREKQASPLECISFDKVTKGKIGAYIAAAQSLASANAKLQTTSSAISAVKLKAASSSIATATAEYNTLNATKARFSAAVAPLCKDYLDTLAKKKRAEKDKDAAKQLLDQYRASVFPAYETAINKYLTRLNAGFRIVEVHPTNPSGRPSSTFAIRINNMNVPLGEPAPGKPSFKSTLSAGDRNTLALAFFFASLDCDSALATRIVVIDDPASSLDDGRSLATAQEVRDLVGRTMQVIVLSHTKPLLCRIWEHADRSNTKTFELARCSSGSDLIAWTVTDDCLTEYDKNHATLREYSDSNLGDVREVARGIRPVIEGFLRVAYPEHVHPGTLLGAFRGLAKKSMGTTAEILSKDDLREFSDIVEYANKFHHNTNHAWQTEIINDSELLGFVRRTLDFTRR